MLQYHYCISALLIYICTIYLFYVKKHIKDNQSVFFESMLWAGLISCVFNIVSAEAIKYIGEIPSWTFYLIVSIYLIVQSCIPFLSCLYGLTLIGRHNKLTVREQVFLYTPFLLTVILVLTNYWTKLVFYADGDGNNTPGIAFAFILIQTAYYLVLIILYSFYYKMYLAARIRYMLIIGSIGIMIIILLDIVLLNNMIQSLFVSIYLFLAFVIIQNSEEVMVDSSGLLTDYALIKQSQLDMINKYPFTILLIKLEDKAIINYTFGLNSWITLLDKVSDYLKSLGRYVYKLEDGMYAIMLRNDYSPDDKELLVKSIASKFEFSKWDVNGDLSTSVQMLELSYPQDIEEIIDISNYIKYYGENMVNTNRAYLTVADLNLKAREQLKERKKKLWDIIESSQYELCFMPIYCVSRQRIISREPLLKLPMNPPVYVSPRELDNETTDYRQLNRMHRKIFEDICIYLKNHPADPDKMEYMNVSIPATQIMHKDFIEQYRLIVKKHMIDFNRIGIELSAVMAFYNQPVIMQNILKLNELGIPFILDQFGTGYNSFEHFEEINFNFVKLDKSIVRACLDNEKGLAVLNGIIAMMKQLDVVIIADGVDSKELADLLISIGIDNLEGTYYLERDIRASK